MTHSVKGDEQKVYHSTLPFGYAVVRWDSPRTRDEGASSISMIHPNCGKVQEWWLDNALVQHSAVCLPVVTRRDETGAAVAWRWERQ